MNENGTPGGRATAAGLGTSQGLGLGLGLGSSRGLGLGLGLGNGLGLGSGLGLAAAQGNGLGLGSGPVIPVGADGGIGVVRSYYATPIELALLPWALNFTPDNTGREPFPLDFIVSPYQVYQDGTTLPKVLEWTTADWDPDLRFWSLPFDPTLTEWLRAADRSEPATLAALEFAAHADVWHPAALGNMTGQWLEPKDLEWRYVVDENATVTQNEGRAIAAFHHVRTELELLKVYMEDDRQSYLVECDVQADGLPAYLMHFLGMNSFDHPYSLKLIDVGLALGNVAYMSYKAFFKRVRPSVLRSGLTVPFGPPAHPAFPSGHAFLANLLALMLLEIPGIYQRFGVSRDGTPKGGAVLTKPRLSDLTGEAAIASPLLQIAQRIAVNRERIGVHYPSDSSASRHLAAGIWNAMLNPVEQGQESGFYTYQIHCPTLLNVLEQAKSEWPTPWPAETH